MAESALASRRTSGVRTAQIVFALLLISAVIGFWPSYLRGVTFSGAPFSSVVHLHAALMGLWVVMLIAQPTLIRARRLNLHRMIGRASFVVVPLVVVSGLLLVHELHNLGPEITVIQARTTVFSVAQLIALSGAWGLAMVHRRDVQRHMRYMISTGFAVATAPVARAVINWVPGFGGLDIAIAATAVLLLGPLALLIVADRRAGIARSPYWFVTIVLVLMFIGFWTWGASEPWIALNRAFAAIG